MGTCMIDGCNEPSTGESDECAGHLAQSDHEAAARGETPYPCREGHYGCAHTNHGPCHGYQPDPDAALCPDGRDDCVF